jgi:predicted lipoprotein with Yx(FWY)xxD motif
LSLFQAGRHGRTLYLFEKDTRSHSACSGACAGYWPPLLAHGKPIAGAGAKQVLLGTIKRANGSRQVTYAWHPLYRYILDTKRGQTSGEGSTLFGAGWGRTHARRQEDRARWLVARPPARRA